MKGTSFDWDKSYREISEAGCFYNIILVLFVWQAVVQIYRIFFYIALKGASEFAILKYLSYTIKVMAPFSNLMLII